MELFWIVYIGKFEIVREPELPAELSASVADDHNWEGDGHQTDE